MDLAKAERNEIFNAVVAGRLDPADCELDYVSYDKGFQIKHTPTRSAFSALADEDPYRFLSHIANDPSDITWVPAGSWNELIAEISQWSQNVATWLSTPDLWAIRNNWRSLVSSQYEEAANAPFTPEEQDAISRQLAAVRESVKQTYALAAEQGKCLDAWFAEAEKASKRVGRKDWILLFSGTVFTLIITAIITPDIAQHVLLMTAHGIEHLFSAGPAAVSHRLAVLPELS